TDRSKQRLPRNITACIFRGYPARGQSYVAERLQDEGWFDEGWKIVGWFPEDRFSDGKPAVVGGPQLGSGQAWVDRHPRSTGMGEATLLLVSPERREVLERQAREFAKKHNLQPNELPRDVAPQFRGDERMEQGAKAFAFLHWLGFYRQLTNFTHFYDCSAAE